MSEVEEIIEDKIPTLEDLQNPENVEKVEEVKETEMTASEYKKSLNKKVSEMTEEERSHYNALAQKKKRNKYNALAQKKKRKKDKEVEKIKLSEEQEKEDLETRNTLYNQLYVLKEKFPEGTKNIHIDPDMSLTILEEKKSLILKLISDKNSHRVVFQSLLLLCRTGERSLDYFDIDVLKGYSDEVSNCEDDIVPILKEMIDLGEIDTSFLTPQLRLMIVMSGCAVKTMEKNLAKKKVQDIETGLEDK